MSLDPQAFMNSTTTEVGSTIFEPIPSGEYSAIIEAVNPPRNVGDRHVMDVFFLLLAPDIAAKLGRDKLVIKQGYFLDFSPNFGLDMSKGKNIALNKLRDALGQLKNNWSPRDLIGAGPLKVQVGLRSDRINPDVIYNEIKAVEKGVELL